MQIFLVVVYRCQRIGQNLGVGVSPQWFVELHSMPGHVRQAAPWLRLTGEKTCPPQARMALAEGDQLLDEAEHRLLSFVKRPIEPAQLIILAIAIIVPALGSQHFIPGQDHWHSLTQEQESQEILGLLTAQPQNQRVVSISFMPTVPTAVVICSIAVVFT